MELDRPKIHSRMRELHAWIVDHDCRVGTEHGCQCAFWHSEMRDLWLKLNPNATAFWPRAGPYFGGGMAVSDTDEAGKIQKMLREIHDDDYEFLKQTDD